MIEATGPADLDQSSQRLVIVVGGLFTGEKELDRKLYGGLLNISDRNALVTPARRGVAKFKEIYNKAEDDIGSAIERSPDAKPLLIGHSLGGLVAMNFIHENPEAVSRAVIIAGALGRLPFESWLLRYPWKDARDKSRQTIEAGEIGTEVDYIGSATDMVVGVNAALPGDGSRHLVTQRSNVQIAGVYPGIEAITTKEFWHLTHEGIVRNPGVLALCREAVNQPQALDVVSHAQVA